MPGYPGGVRDHSLEEYANVNILTSVLTVTSKVTAKASDLSLTDTVVETSVWIHSEE